MILFAVSRNRRLLARGGVEEGVLSAIVSSTTTGDGTRELRCHLGGLEARQTREERLEWIDLEELRPDDEITIQILEDREADPAARRVPVETQPSLGEGTFVVECSFCGLLRNGRASVAGARSTMCLPCRVMAQEMVSRQVESILHLASREDGSCSFCHRPNRARVVATGEHGICSECLQAVPFAG